MRKDFLFGFMQFGANHESLRNTVYSPAKLGHSDYFLLNKEVEVKREVAFYADSFEADNVLILLGGKIFDIQGCTDSERSSPGWVDCLLKYIYLAYREEGTEIFKRLYGDFAIAILDYRGKKFFLARDALGVVPLFFSVINKGIIFGPSMAMVLGGQRHSSAFSASKVFTFLQGSELPSHLSCFENVYRLPASHFLEFDQNGIANIRRYIQLGRHVHQNNFSFEENAELMKAAFRRAVEQRLPVSGPIAAEVSGGIDSSSVFAVARSLAGDRLVPMSGIFSDHKDCDESEFIDAVCGKWGASSNKLDIDKLSLVDNITESLQNFYGLLNPANIHISLSMLKLAKQLGCGAVLNGVDGDNVVSHGRHHLVELGLAGDWDEFTRVVRAVAPSYARYSKNPQVALCYSFGVPALVRSLKFGRVINFTRGLRAIMRVNGLSRRMVIKLISSGLRQRQTRFNEQSQTVSLRNGWQGRFLREAYNPDFLAKIDSLSTLSSAFGGSTRQFFSEKQAHIAQFENGVNQHYFEYTWANSHVYGVPTVSPFMDRAFVEFCISIPPEQKLRNGYSRAIFREAMSDYLPLNLRTRQWKTDLSPSSLSKLRNEVLPKFCKNLSEDPSPLSQIIDKRFLEAQISDAKRPNFKRDSAIRVWVLFCLDTWLRQEDVAQNIFATQN